VWQYDPQGVDEYVHYRPDTEGGGATVRIPVATTISPEQESWLKVNIFLRTGEFGDA